MGEQDDIRVIHEVYADFGQDNVEGVISRLTDTVTWTTPGSPEVIPYAGERKGHEDSAAVVAAFTA